MLHISFIEARRNYADFGLTNVHGREYVKVGNKNSIVQARNLVSPRRTRNTLTQDKFDALTKAWISNIRYCSSLDQIVDDENYRTIISFGREALPYIFRDLRASPKAWFVALRRITGENPVGNEHAGSFKEMTACWIGWADSKGF